MKTVTISATREGYDTRQVVRHTMSIAELIDVMQEFADAYGEDVPVVISNDGGYTYGPIRYESVDVEGVEE